MIELNKIYCGDCLELMPQIETGSVDMILCDLPYGTTACKWDTIIPFDKLWTEYIRLIKSNGVIALTAAQPFTSALVMSNPKLFKYEIIFEKDRPTNPLLAKKQPMRYHENILIFYKSQPTYNYQMEDKKIENIRTDCRDTGTHETETLGKTKILNGDASTLQIYPRSIQKFNRVQNTIHPTQKPVGLFKWLIETYTNEGETVLDNCIGSGTTAVACKQSNRNYIGIEKDEKYCKDAQQRLETFLF
jgi:site-specific DNA-methyltransferase (adenine-specific)